MAVHAKLAAVCQALPVRKGTFERTIAEI